MNLLHSIDYAIVGVYLLAMIGLGFLLSSRIRHFKDYFLAGGMLTTPLLVCTLVSTYYELDVTFATSESGFYYGMVAWTWLSRPYYVCIILAAVFLAPRLKKHLGFMTLPDLLEHRYGKSTRIVGAVACLTYSLPLTALAGMVAMFEVLDFPPMIGLGVAVAVCALYTMIGGLWADAVSDTIQFVLMCVSVAIAIPLALNWVGGFGFTEHLPAEHLTATGGLRRGLILAWTVGALTVFVEPAFYQRIFAAESIQAVRRSLLIGIFLWAAYDWGVVLLGLIAQSAVARGLLAEDLEGKQALMTISLQVLPIGLRGLFLGGVLAAAMSSVDSYSLLASGNLVYDILARLWPRPISDRMMIRLTRIGIFVVMGLAAALVPFFDRITDAWTAIAGMLASVVFVPVMGAVFFRPRRAAGLAAATAGLITYLVFYAMVLSLGTYDDDAESYVWRPLAVVGQAAPEIPDVPTPEDSPTPTPDSPAPAPAEPVFPDAASEEEITDGLELWREYAVLFALPMSLLGFLAGQATDRRPPLGEEQPS